ncbi:MAG: CHAT domain-containing protein [Goleter apudmare HA4340-LM2]|jgi:CHAT domain-containing protein|nr:CHAT domain-containing protein [Goleter apudmare HA4340-LM2]
MFNKLWQSITSYWLTILFLASLTFSLCLGNLYLSSPINAQTTDTVQLVNQGIASYKNGDFRNAIATWLSAINLYQKNNDLQNVAILNENLARAYQQLGDTAKTLNYWEKVIAYYRTQKDLQKVGRVLTEIAQIYINSGQTKKAISLLCGVSELLNCQTRSALQIAQQQKDQSGEIAALGSLGEAYRLQGNYDLAIKYLETARNHQNQTYNFVILNSLGNAHTSLAQLWHLRANSAKQQKISKASVFQQQAIDNYQKAREYFQDSIQISQQDKVSELRSHLNLIKLSYLNIDRNLFNPSQLEVNIRQALEIIEKLPDSIDKVYAAIDLANLPALGVELASPLTQCFPTRRLPETQIKQLLSQAIKVAQALQDARSESYALGAFGHFYECQGNQQLAIEFTNRAILLADQNLQIKDSLYLWEWQVGRILQKQGKTNEALLFYQRAYNILEQLRSDILTSNRDFQFDFRDVVEPVYRELAEIQLKLATSQTKNITVNKPQLSSVLTTINSLRLAEIQNYFGNDCILSNFSNNINTLVTNDTAVISSIILQYKTGVILSLPNQEEHIHWINKDREAFRQDIAKFRHGLLQQQLINYNTADAENLYELIIHPLEKYLVSQKIKTLVFIQDGFLRDVPMAALYDQKERKYLIQKYAIATTSSLQLTNPKKGNLQSSDRALVLAVTQAATIDDKTWPALNYVSEEFQSIKQTFVNSQKLENDEFNQNNLAAEIKKQAYPIVHIATHAQFGIIPEDTFLVAGNNEKLTINQLETLLRQAGNTTNSVELLALTACETATGDDRATLGLAGVALQASTKSALASLWSVDDESTANLVAEFYHKLRNSGMSKAQALQAAQVKLINAKQTPEIDKKYDHPYYWSAFILIGNWL